MMEVRAKRVVILKFGAAIALSFAGFLYTRFRTSRFRSYSSSTPSDDGHRAHSRGNSVVGDNLHGLQPASSENYVEVTSKVGSDNHMVDFSPISEPLGDNRTPVWPDIDEPEEEFVTTHTVADISLKEKGPEGTPKSFECLGKDDLEQENKHLRNLVKMLRERERCLETQLLNYYDLEEEEAAAMELQNQLQIIGEEAKLLKIKVESLQADNLMLVAQAADHAKAVAELEAARAEIKSLNKKLRHEAEQNKERILILQQRVMKLQEEERDVYENGLGAQTLKDLEGEMRELKDSNMRLQLENLELAHRLELKEECDHLKEEDFKGSAEKMERCPADQCNAVEDLVYLQWLNAFLQYEPQAYTSQTGNTIAGSQNQSSSLKSEKKARQLILASVLDFDSDRWSSSEASFLSSSGELDATSIEDSSASGASKMKFFSKLRKLVRLKNSHRHGHASSKRQNLLIS